MGKWGGGGGGGFGVGDRCENGGYISTFVRIFIKQCEMNCWYLRTDTTDMAQFLLVSAKRSGIPKKATSYPYLCKSFSAELNFGRVHTLDILLMNSD